MVAINFACGYEIFTSDQETRKRLVLEFVCLQVGIVGRNLITWTDYQGYDPEVGYGGGTLGSAVNARVDSYGYPNYRTFSFTLDVDF